MILLHWNISAPPSVWSTQVSNSMLYFNSLCPNLSVNTDRLQAALAGYLRGYASPAAVYLKH